MRLIDADELKATFIDQIAYMGSEVKVHLNRAKTFGLEIFICPHCGHFGHYYMDVADADAYEGVWIPNYCPNCGDLIVKVEPQKENNVKCIECKYLMFSDCYGECSKAYMGIVHPWDSCGKGELKDKDKLTDKECKNENCIR